MNKRSLFLACTLAITCHLLPLTTTAQGYMEDMAKKTGKRLIRYERKVPNEYIINLSDDVNEWEVEAVASEMADTYKGTILSVYTPLFKGFSISLRERDALALSEHLLVKFIEENGLALPSGIDDMARGTAPALGGAFFPAALSASLQNYPPSWGLDRIDHRWLPMDQKYYYNYTGNRVHVYVVDSGINYDHLDLVGRVDTNTASWAGGSVNFAEDPEGKRGTNYIDDCTGHGTKVASIIGGQDLGVAKGVVLHAVRVTNCSNNSTSTPITRIYDGLRWVLNNKKSPAVVNLSINFSSFADTSIEAAITTLVDAGVTVVVSAGNSGTTAPCDAAYNMPGRMTKPGVIVVGASNQRDDMWAKSCTGSSVDLYAPGEGVMGATYLKDFGGVIDSGTSFAAPHVAGFAAIVLETSNWLRPDQVESVVVSNASAGRVRLPSGAYGRLLYTR